ncbi:MAG: hypothetical protein HOE11_01960 [Candidatus Diapherotrites archaeon]|jgi:hypothetical protein|nr:hypothetical protein [Candidatus Diapherotrites archaeon]MBT4596689.1 hypothetical protein [Candidatus Diapherotrites archaeon]
MKRLLIVLIALCFLASMTFAATPKEEFIVLYKGSDLIFDDMYETFTYNELNAEGGFLDWFNTKSWKFDLDDPNQRDLTIIYKVGLATYGWHFKFSPSIRGSEYVNLEIIKFGSILKEEANGTACLQNQAIHLRGIWTAGKKIVHNQCLISFDLDKMWAIGSDISLSNFTVDQSVRKEVLWWGAKLDIKTGLADLRKKISYANRSFRTIDTRLDFLEVDNGIKVHSDKIYFDEESGTKNTLLVSEDGKLLYAVLLPSRVMNNFAVLKPNKELDVSQMKLSEFNRSLADGTFTDVTDTKREVSEGNGWKEFFGPALIGTSAAGLATTAAVGTTAVTFGVGPIAALGGIAAIAPVSIPIIIIAGGVAAVVSLDTATTSYVYDNKLLLNYDSEAIPGGNELKVNYVIYSPNSSIDKRVPTDIDYDIVPEDLRVTDNLELNVTFNTGESLLGYFRRVSKRSSFDMRDLLEVMVLKDVKGNEIEAEFFARGANKLEVVTNAGHLVPGKEPVIEIIVEDTGGTPRGLRLRIKNIRFKNVSAAPKKVLTKKDPCSKIVKRSDVTKADPTFDPIFNVMRKKIDKLYPNEILLKPVIMYDNGVFSDFLVISVDEKVGTTGFARTLFFTGKPGANKSPFSYVVEFNSSTGEWRITYIHVMDRTEKVFRFTDEQLAAGESLVNDSASSGGQPVVPATTNPSPVTLVKTNDGTCVETNLSNIQTTIINTNETQAVVQVLAPTVTVTQATSPTLTNETETIDVVITNIPGLATGQVDSTTGRVDSVTDTVGAVSGVVFSTGTVGAVAGIINTSTGQVNYVTNAVPVITNVVPEVITNAVPVVTNEMPEVVTNVIPVSSSNVCDVVATSAVSVVGIITNDMTNACEALVSNNVGVTGVVTSTVPGAVTNVVPDAYNITNSVPVVTNTVLGTVTNTPVATSNVCDVVATSSVPVVGVVFNDMTNACEVLVSNNIPVTAVVTSAIPNVVSNVTDTVSNKTYVVATTNGAIGVGETNVVIQLEPAISETGEVAVVESVGITSNGATNVLGDVPIVVTNKMSTQIVLQVTSPEGVTNETFDVGITGTVDNAELVLTNANGAVRVDLPKPIPVDADQSTTNIVVIPDVFAPNAIPVTITNATGERVEGTTNISINARIRANAEILALLNDPERDKRLATNQAAQSSSFTKRIKEFVMAESVGMNLNNNGQKIAFFVIMSKWEHYFLDFFGSSNAGLNDDTGLLEVFTEVDDKYQKVLVQRIGEGIYITPFEGEGYERNKNGSPADISNIMPALAEAHSSNTVFPVMDVELFAGGTTWQNGDKVRFKFYQGYGREASQNNIVDFVFNGVQNKFVLTYPGDFEKIGFSLDERHKVQLPTDKVTRANKMFEIRFSDITSKPKVEILNIFPEEETE